MFKKPNCPVIAVEEHYWDAELSKTYVGPGIRPAGAADDRDGAARAPADPHARHGVRRGARRGGRSRRELAREGQVFYLHNRVETIHEAAEKLRRLVPEARIGVGHGQMDDKQLEQAMVEFLRGDLDVLVATTIIESGLDIPQVNTLIIERADVLGWPSCTRSGAVSDGARTPPTPI